MLVIGDPSYIKNPRYIKNLLPTRYYKKGEAYFHQLILGLSPRMMEFVALLVRAEREAASWPPVHDLSASAVMKTR